jgi:hypothetical protein
MKKEARLQLSEYSNKYKVSVSTLRRRIKAGEIQYDFEGGKYWLPDRPIEKYVRNRPAIVEEEPVIEFPVITENFIDDEPAVAQPSQNTNENYVTHEEVLELTQSMINELKSAYVLILQEKEEQILEAKREIADLKTLCHTLETENEKLKAETSAPLSGWFSDDVEVLD